MAAITAGLVKELRDKTGAGMMDCKKALVETDGDIEEAVDFLRKNGLAAAAKKSAGLRPRAWSALEPTERPARLSKSMRKRISLRATKISKTL